MDWQSLFLSGLAGSVITQLFLVARGEYKRHREYRALLDGIIAECDYNISIIDEILEGVVEGNGSFKRLSIDYFRSIRELSVKYSFSQELLKALSRLIVDMELFNFEADYVFDGRNVTQVYTGLHGHEKVCLTKTAITHDIRETISSARDGVLGSLENLKKIAKAKGRAES